MTRSLVIALALAGACCTAGGSSAQQADRIYGLQLPPRLGLFERKGEIHSYEAEAPGFGYSVAYRKRHWTMTVYVYDRGLRSIGNGAADTVVVQEFEASKHEIIRTGERGTYRSLKWIRDFYAPIDGGDPRFICSQFELTFPKADHLSDSFLCLTGWKDKFVKFRLSGSHNATSAMEANVTAGRWMQILMGVAPSP